MAGKVPQSAWLEAFEASAFDVAGSALGCEASVVLERGAMPPPQMPGAYLPLVGEDEQVQLALGAAPEHCQALAKMMMQLGTDAEDLPSGDVADAMNEIVNIMAGAVKTRLLPTVPTLRLGLPIFIHGQPEPTDRLVTSVAHVKLGAVPATLLVVQHRDHAAP